MFSAHFYLLVSAISSLLSVILGAFGAHGLKKVLSTDMLATYQTAVQYQFLHSLALLALAILILTLVTKPEVINTLKWSANLMIMGVLLFSGSLYTMTFMSVLGGFPTWLGMITPIGGLTLIIAWAFLATAALKLPIEDK